MPTGLSYGESQRFISSYYELFHGFIKPMVKDGVVVKDRNGKPRFHEFFSILHNPIDDTLKSSPLRITAKKFADMGVGQLFNTDLVSFMELPAWFADMLFDIAADCNAETKKKTDELNNALKPKN